MHPHLEEVCALLDASRAALRQAVDAVPPAARGTRPAADRWSVTDVLEHVARAETHFASTVAAELAAARAAGLAAEAAPRVPLDPALRHRIADRGERRQAPDDLHPRGGLDADAAWAAVEAARARFVDTLRAADGLALGAVFPEHRRWGRLSVYQWAELVAAHAHRHAAQIREIAAA